MLVIWNKFYDKYWNFNNEKFVKLLNKAKKALYVPERKTKMWDIQINLFNNVSRKELWSLINKLSIYTNSWIDIKATLALVIKQLKNPYLKGIVTEMKDNIDHWINIHETMARYPKVFDELTIALIAVWEKTWQLGKILNELDNSLLENIELRWKVKWALVYPAILLTLTIVMVVFLMVFIVPKITDAFLQTGVALPALTQVIVKFSNFLINDWIKLIISAILLYILLKFANSTYYWKITFANISVRFPIFGYIVKQSNIIYFIRSFTILLDSWVLLLESLKTSSTVVPNLAYKKELIRVKNEVELWLTISKSLWLNTDYEDSVYLNPLFPEDFAFVINTWEETGSLSQSMKRIWDNYNWELKRYIWNLSSMMEPLIIVLIGWMVWVIIIGIMLPFFEIGKVVKLM